MYLTGKKVDFVWYIPFKCQSKDCFRIFFSFTTFALEDDSLHFVESQCEEEKKHFVASKGSSRNKIHLQMLEYERTQHISCFTLPRLFFSSAQRQQHKSASTKHSSVTQLRPCPHLEHRLSIGGRWCRAANANPTELFNYLNHWHKPEYEENHKMQVGILVVHRLRLCGLSFGNTVIVRIELSCEAKVKDEVMGKVKLLSACKYNWFISNFMRVMPSFLKLRLIFIYKISHIFIGAF